MAYLDYDSASLRYRANEPYTWVGVPFVVKARRSACEKPATIGLRHQTHDEGTQPYMLTTEEAMAVARALLGAVNYTLGGAP